MSKVGNRKKKKKGTPVGGSDQNQTNRADFVKEDVSVANTIIRKKRGFRGETPPSTTKNGRISKKSVGKSKKKKVKKSKKKGRVLKTKDVNYYPVGSYSLIASALKEYLNSDGGSIYKLQGRGSFARSVRTILVYGESRKIDLKNLEQNVDLHFAESCRDYLKNPEMLDKEHGVRGEFTEWLVSNGFTEIDWWHSFKKVKLFFESDWATSNSILTTVDEDGEDRESWTDTQFKRNTYNLIWRDYRTLDKFPSSLVKIGFVDFDIDEKKKKVDRLTLSISYWNYRGMVDHDIDTTKRGVEKTAEEEKKAVEETKEVKAVEKVEPSNVSNVGIDIEKEKSKQKETELLIEKEKSKQQAMELLKLGKIDLEMFKTLIS